MQETPSRVLRRKKRKVRWPRVFLLLFILLVMVAGTFRAGIYAYQLLFPPRMTMSSANSNLQYSTGISGKTINILLLGIDDGDVENPKAPKRSDTMIVASINPDTKSIALLSIPRDTRVQIPGKTGYDKITHAYAYGGIELSKRTVEELLAIPIHHYITIEWDGFIKVIDLLGGVNLYVEKPMNYEDPYAKLAIHLKQGYQQLDGQKAGQYVRFRSDELGDIGRVQRQQRFLKAISSEFFQVGTIVKLPALLSAANNYVDTDLTIFSMMKLATSINAFGGGNVQTQMLPGNFGDIKGLSYWIPDAKKTKQVVQNLHL